jgi:hypothetical protein
MVLVPCMKPGSCFAALTELVKRTSYLLRIRFVIPVLFPNHQTVISGIIVKAYMNGQNDPQILWFLNMQVWMDVQILYASWTQNSKFQHRSEQQPRAKTKHDSADNPCDKRMPGNIIASTGITIHNTMTMWNLFTLDPTEDDPIRFHMIHINIFIYIQLFQFSNPESKQISWAMITQCSITRWGSLLTLTIYSRITTPCLGTPENRTNCLSDQGTCGQHHEDNPVLFHAHNIATCTVFMHLWSQQDQTPPILVQWYMLL